MSDDVLAIALKPHGNTYVIVVFMDKNTRTFQLYSLFQTKVHQQLDGPSLHIYCGLQALKKKKNTKVYKLVNNTDMSTAGYIWWKLRTTRS